MKGEALCSDVALSGPKTTFDVLAFSRILKVLKWPESTLLEDIALGALRAVSPLSTQIGVFHFFLAFARSKKSVLENSRKHALDHCSGFFRIYSPFFCEGVRQLEAETFSEILVFKNFMLVENTIK